MTENLSLAECMLREANTHGKATHIVSVCGQQVHLALVRWMVNSYELIIRLKHGSPTQEAIDACIKMMFDDEWEITEQRPWGKSEHKGNAIWCMKARRKLDGPRLYQRDLMQKVK